MKIVDNSGVPVSRTTTLNDIPMGQVFRGTIISHERGNVTGLFLKAVGSWYRYKDSSQRGDVIVIALDQFNDSGSHRFLFDCRTVTDYQPLDVTLTINKVSR